MQQLNLISPRELDRYVQDPDALVIDLREEEEFRISHIRGAVNVPYESVRERFFPEEKLLVLYCDRGGSSLETARYLTGKGYQACSVVGGFAAYRGRNLVFSG